MSISHDQYLQGCRERAVSMAEAMLRNDIGVIEGSRQMRHLLFEAGLDGLEEPLVTFVLIESETDALPLGDVRQYWEAGALACGDSGGRDILS